jgi:ABC-2 type transport system permease protein
MNFIAAIFRRELKSYFVSPLAYAAIAAYLIIMGLFFLLALNSYQTLRIRAAQSLQRIPGVDILVTNLLSSDSTWPLILIVPLLTMRLLAEERRQHTAELLLTAPITTRHIVWGKFLGAWFILACMLLLSIWMPLTLWKLGDADPARIVSGCAGALLYGGLVLALGLLASSLTESPFLAAILALVLTAASSFLTGLAGAVPVIGATLTQFTPGANLATFASGVIETQALIYFVSITIMFNEITAGVIDSQRWR